MVELEYGDKPFGQKNVICLGAFDSLHNGHKSIIKQAKSAAASSGAKTLVFTFENGLGLVESGKKTQVFTYAERLQILAELGVYGVIRAHFNEKFANTSAEDFIKKLFEQFAPSCVFCGEDYRYGKNASGDITSLKKACDEHGVELVVCPFVKINGEKISTSNVKRALERGDVKLASEFLGEDYFICGTVETGRKEGRTIGFPTANISLPPEKFKLKEGVYKTYAYINGKRYYGITNCGKAPTFGFEKLKIETYFKDFSGDIYGENLKINFVDFLREDKKFSSAEELKAQLKKDLQA